jgi:hypothetical protein
MLTLTSKTPGFAPAVSGHGKAASAAALVHSVVEGDPSLAYPFNRSWDRIVDSLQHGA